MKIETPETKSIKQTAKRLQQILGTEGIKYPYGKALEAAAKLQGHAGWSVAHAASRVIPDCIKALSPVVVSNAPLISYSGPFDLHIGGIYYTECKSLNLTEALVEAMELARTGINGNNSVGLYPHGSSKVLASFGVLRNPDPLSSGYLPKKCQPNKTFVIGLASNDNYNIDCVNGGYVIYAMSPVSLPPDVAVDIADQIIMEVKDALGEDLAGDTYDILCARLEILGFTITNPFYTKKCWD